MVCRSDSFPLRSKRSFAIAQDDGSKRGEKRLFKGTLDFCRVQRPFLPHNMTTWSYTCQQRGARSVTVHPKSVSARLCARKIRATSDGAGPSLFRVECQRLFYPIKILARHPDADSRRQKDLFEYRGIIPRGHAGHSRFFPIWRDSSRRLSGHLLRSASALRASE